LDYILDHEGTIYDAVATQPWSGDAVVSVSIVNWIRGESPTTPVLWLNNGTIRLEVAQISGALSPEVDLRTARQLVANQVPKCTFQGQTPGHEAFVLHDLQVQTLTEDEPNSRDFIHPYLTGDDLIHVGRSTRHIIDLPTGDAVVAGLVAPRVLDYLRLRVLPTRQAAADEEMRRNTDVVGTNPRARLNIHHSHFLDTWWRLSYRRDDMLAALAGLPRYIALSRVSSELRPTVYSFVSSDVRPGDALQAFAFDDDYSFGILQSSVHGAWFRERCSTLETRLRYTAGTVFNSFPWPQQPELARVERVADVVVRLQEYRDARLSEGASLGGMYDALREPGRSPLRELHTELDAAVVELYGFSSGEDLLAQLLALNLNVARLEAENGLVTRPGPGGLPGVRRSTSMITI